jgi:hypothetical protein
MNWQPIVGTLILGILAQMAKYLKKRAIRKMK